MVQVYKLNHIDQKGIIVIKEWDCNLELLATLRSGSFFKVEILS